MTNDIRSLLERISAQSRRDCGTMLREAGLHVGQDNFLMCPEWSGESLTLKQLCDVLKCEPPTITRMVNSLEKRDIIYKKTDAIDARVTRVHLTEEGKKLRLPVLNVWKKQEEKLLEGISNEERETLQKILIKMEKNITR